MTTVTVTFRDGTSKAITAGLEIHVLEEKYWLKVITSENQQVFSAPREIVQFYTTDLALVPPPTA